MAWAVAAFGTGMVSLEKALVTSTRPTLLSAFWQASSSWPARFSASGSFAELTDALMLIPHIHAPQLAVVAGMDVPASKPLGVAFDVGFLSPN